MIAQSQEFCAGYLYTHIDTEGTMSGFPMHVAEELKQATARKLIVAGGIKAMDEVTRLDGMGIDAVVGMAVYTGAMKA
jgi:phosphoribosylformimino-5-aminoimidazole carboxamide ribotide isomerase